MRRKSNFIPAELFSKRYGVPIGSIYSYKHYHKNHKNCGIKQLNSGKLLVDEVYFLRRDEFKKKIKLAAQENYYFLTCSITSLSLAKILSRYSSRSYYSWSVFMSVELFIANHNSIIFMRDFQKLWEFFRLTRALIRAIFKTVGVPINKRDYNTMYDYKYGKAA